MINTAMNNNKKQTTKPPSTRKPNEVGGFYFSSGIKIFDPETNNIILQKRGDC